MFFKWIQLIFLSVMLLPLWAEAEEPSPSASEVAQQLKAADRFRLRFDEGEVLTDIELYREGQRVESNRYRVLFNGKGESRVEMLDTRAKGQKVLLLSDAMWLFVPRTKRAIRITPMQRLMGQASYGDVANMRWADEYEWNGETYESTPSGSETLLKVGLIAKRRSSTYRRVVLWLEPNSNRPVRAEFYLASGKLMKTAHYKLAEGSRERIDQTRFTQPGKSQEYTLMHSHEPVQRSLSGMLFTRQGFVR